MPEDFQDNHHKVKRLSERNRRILFLAAVILSAAVAIYGIVRLIGYGSDYLSAQQTSRELREIAAETDAVTAAPSAAADGKHTAEPTAAPVTQPPVTAVPETAGNQETAASADSGRLPTVSYPSGMKVNSKIQKLKKKSSYIVGWLTMDDLDEPVVMRDNSYFLNHDPLGKHNDNGALFLDEDTELLSRPYTLLIYGHNMKTGAMFGNLRKYEQASYCYQHRYVQFDTIFETGKYEIFAVSVINLNPGLARYLSLSDLQSPVRSVRKSALNTLETLSSVPGLTRVSEEDQVLLLITCVGNDDERLVVAARRMPEETRARK